MQVLIDKNSFIFDHIYGGGGSPSINMFEECVMPLLDALFQGYNSTVIAYGQVLFKLFVKKRNIFFLKSFVRT